MGRKKRVVFVHELDGVNRQLFLVIENADSSLSIFLKLEDSLAEPSSPHEIFKDTPTFRRLKTNHISIHNSDDSTGMLVKKTNEPVEGDKETHACFVAEAKSRLMHPVSFNLFPDLSNKKYDIRKPSDAMLKIGSSSRLDAATLSIAILVCGLDETVPSYSWNSLAVVDFNRYRIVVYYCFLNVIPSRHGSSCFFATEKGGTNHGGVESIELNELEKLLYETFQALAATKIQNQINETPEHVAILQSHPIYFHPNVGDLLLGRFERAENLV